MHCRTAYKPVWHGSRTHEPLARIETETLHNVSSPSSPNLESAERTSLKGRRLFLIDTMGYIFRAYHALPRLTNRSGLATHAVYGMNNMLRKLIADYHPEYIAAVFDLAGPTFRHETYADYKANRAEMPDELGAQLPYIHRLLEAMRIRELAHERYEADDVIGAAAREAAASGMEVLIITSDKDMLQLVGERVCVINPMKGDLLCDSATVEELMGVGP